MRKANSLQLTAYSIKNLTFLIAGCWLLAAGCCYAEAVSSTELIEKAREMDGKRITYQGEIITAVLGRGEYSWANLNDGVTAIGVWCKTGQLGFVKSAGDYKHKGDIVEAEGVFNRACPLHKGELDIHADKIKLLKPGYFTEEKIDKNRLNLSIAIFLVTLVMVAIFRHRT